MKQCVTKWFDSNFKHEINNYALVIKPRPVKALPYHISMLNLVKNLLLVRTLIYYSIIGAYVTVCMDEALSKGMC